MLWLYVVYAVCNAITQHTPRIISEPASDGGCEAVSHFLYAVYAVYAVISLVVRGESGIERIVWR